MHIGVCVASHINDVGYVVRAEELGYSHAWMADSQMLWSDCFATLALVADRTSRINIGTGVAISGTRPAPVNAAGIATINALAPGRTFFGVGAGNTAMRVMDYRPSGLRNSKLICRPSRLCSKVKKPGIMPSRICLFAHHAGSRVC